MAVILMPTFFPLHPRRVVVFILLINNDNHHNSNSCRPPTHSSRYNHNDNQTTNTYCTNHLWVNITHPSHVSSFQLCICAMSTKFPYPLAEPNRQCRPGTCDLCFLYVITCLGAPGSLLSLSLSQRWHWFSSKKSIHFIWCVKDLGYI